MIDDNEPVKRVRDNNESASSSAELSDDVLLIYDEEETIDVQSISSGSVRNDNNYSKSTRILKFKKSKWRSVYRGFSLILFNCRKTRE